MQEQLAAPLKSATSRYINTESRYTFKTPWYKTLYNGRFLSQEQKQVVSTALPSCKNSEAVACAVKAFMTANLPNELIELLEKSTPAPRCPEL